MRTSRTMQLIRDTHDDNTAELQSLVACTARVERLVWRAAGAGLLSPSGLREIVESCRALRSSAARVLARNQLVASLLCCEAGGLDIGDARTIKRLPALRMLTTRQVEDKEDWAA